MADKIYMDTQLMEQLSSQISQIRQSLNTINDGVARAIQEARRVASGQTGTIQKLSNTQRKLTGTADRAEKLARAVRSAASTWEDAERRVMEKRLPESGNPDNGAGSGQDSSVSRDRLEEAMRVSMGYPSDRSSWSKDMRDKFEKNMKESQTFLTDDGRTAILTGGSIILVGATGAINIFDASASATNASITYKSYRPDGSYYSEEVSSGFDKMGWDGKLLVKDDKGGYKAAKLKPHMLYEDKDGIDTKRIGSILSFGTSASAEYAAWHGEAKGESGIFSGEVSANVSRAECHANIQGGLYASSVDKNGKVTYHLEPGVQAKIGASYSLFDASASGQMGSDNLNLHGSADVAVGKVSGELEGQLGFVDGKFNAYGSAKAEAIAAEAKGEVGVNLGGIEANVTGSVNVGLGAHAEAGYNNGKLKLDVGLSIGVGGSVSVELDVGGFVDNVVEGGKKVVNALQDAGEAFINWLF